MAAPADELRRALEAEGLHIARALTPAALARVNLGLALEDLMPGARAALVVGDGGGAFFARFLAAGDLAGPHPLDRYTERVVRAAAHAALAGSGVAHAVLFPFMAGGPLLPMQRLGQAAGLPPPGPLGLQVHPLYGPWWAYRALVVLATELVEEPPLPAPCAGCPAPCIAACPA